MRLVLLLSASSNGDGVDGWEILHPVSVALIDKPTILKSDLLISIIFFLELYYWFEMRMEKAKSISVQQRV